jgi:hypothetical protein
MDNVTSEKTSGNFIPHLHKWFVNSCKLTRKEAVLDYGAGMFDTGKNYLESHGIKVYRYDPYNVSADENHRALVAFDENQVDAVLCSNVLNVITPDKIKSTLRHLTKASCKLYFTVYEGDRSGIGKATTKGYQANMTTTAWIPELKRHFNTVLRHGKVLEVY